MSELSIGDPIEVRFESVTGPVWRAATVSHVSDREIGATFADHTRLALQRGRGHYRKVRP